VRRPYLLWKGARARPPRPGHGVPIHGGPDRWASRRCGPRASRLEV